MLSHICVHLGNFIEDFVERKLPSFGFKSFTSLSVAYLIRSVLKCRNKYRVWGHLLHYLCLTKIPIIIMKEILPGINSATNARAWDIYYYHIDRPTWFKEIALYFYEVTQIRNPSYWITVLNALPVFSGHLLVYIGSLIVCVNKCYHILHTSRGHGGRVVTLWPPTSEAGVRFPAWPQVGKLVVACRWSAVYSTECWSTVCTGFLCPSNYPSWYDLYSVESDVKPQINI